MMHHPKGSGVRRALVGTLLLGLLFGTLHVSEAAGGSVSNKPTRKNDKAKIQMLQAYVPAMKRDPETNTAVMISTDQDSNCPVGILDKGKCKVHPLVVAYMEENDAGSKAYDIHAAVSLDEGATWKRTDLTKSSTGPNEGWVEYRGPRCFTIHGEDDGDHTDHGNGGRYLHEGDDEEPKETFHYRESSFKPMLVAKKNLILVAWPSNRCKGGLRGPDDEGDPDNVLTNSDELDLFQVKGGQRCHDYTGETEDAAELGKVPLRCVWAARGIVNTSNGDITWTKPERLTSGRRDPFQLVAAVSGNGAAWALAWQEDPKGLRLGEAAGPGDGMSGATVNHKTDIWYSYLGKDFAKCGVDGGTCAQEDDDTRPIVTTRFSSPVRVTDNAACKADVNRELKGGPYCEDYCDTLIGPEEAGSGELLYTCVTKDGIPLNGDTGASRPNMFLIPVEDGVEVVLAYEESKGLGKGPPHDDEEELDGEEEEEREDWGKNIYFHHFSSFDKPDLIAHGTMINLPELDATGKPLVSEDGKDILTRNARRVRMIVQPPSKWGKKQLAMAMLYREGEEGHGAPAHIIMRRFVGGYEPEHIECKISRNHPITKEKVCVSGSMDLNSDNIPEEPPDPDDARAHRGFLRGDLLVVGYTYTGKWGRGRPSRYDFFVRRSFDGGKKFTNFRGIKEDPVNLSNIKEEGNRGWSTMEPRLYATPGTIGGDSPKTESDVQNSMVYYAAYGTSHKPEMDDDNEEGPPAGKDEPMEIYWTMTDNWGETYMKVWNENSEKWQYPWLAKLKGDNDEAQFGAVQIRTPPAGDKLFASFLADVPGSSYIETGGGPCRGNGVGSGVCFNSTKQNPLARYDFNGDGKVDREDEKILRKAMANKDISYDLDGDGKMTGFDKQLFRAAAEESLKQSSLNNRRRLYLRGCE